METAFNLTPKMEGIGAMREMIDALTKGAWVQCGHDTEDFRNTIADYMDAFFKALSPRGRKLFEAAIAAEQIALSASANAN